MKFLAIIDNNFPLLSEDKIIYFDTQEEVKNLIEGCYLIFKKDDISIKPIDFSEINNEKYINYKNVHYM